MDRDPIAALAAEEDRLEEILSELDATEWDKGSACEGWSVRDVVLHLAQTEEAVVASLGGGAFAAPVSASVSTIDELMAAWVEAERESTTDPFARWREARRSALVGLRAAPADQVVQWAAAPLKPLTLATTRLSEHWIHALDVSEPLGRELPDSHRLWHIARLAHRTIPYAFARAGRSDPPSVYVELDPPGGGERWTFGDPGAKVTIRGSAGEFCRVAARRLPASGAALEAQGTGADEVLDLIRTYA